MPVSYIQGYDPQTLREIVDVQQCRERLADLGDQVRRNPARWRLDQQPRKTLHGAMTVRKPDHHIVPPMPVRRVVSSSAPWTRIP